MNRYFRAHPSEDGRGNGRRLRESFISLSELFLNNPCLISQQRTGKRRQVVWRLDWEPTTATTECSPIPGRVQRTAWSKDGETFSAKDDLAMSLHLEGGQ